MKRMIVITGILLTLILTTDRAYSFPPEKGFYAEYRIEDSRIQDSRVFALLRDQSLEIKYIDLIGIVYRYQILDIKKNIADIRISLEGELYMGGYENIREIKIPFKKIYDIKLNLDTLEMIDDNGDPWGKWLFWINLGSYNWKEYTIMKNWNSHGEMKGWLKGPWENISLSNFLRSPYAKKLKNYFVLNTVKEEGDTYLYPRFEDFGIIYSYKSHITEEGTIITEPGGYYLRGFRIAKDTEKEGKELPGVFTRYYYTDEGIFFENILPYYMDDFLDQKLGITILSMSSPLILIDYGVKNEILIEDPESENQTSFLEDVIMYLERSETPPETQITEIPQKSELKSGTPLPTKQTQKETNILYYIVPILIVVIIAVFLVVKEGR